MRPSPTARRIVLYKERNALLTRLARTTRVSARVQTNEERAKLAKVRKSMSRIKGVLGERRAAFKEARRHAAGGEAPPAASA